MADTDRSAGESAEAGTESLDRLAGGWHRIQLAVLGFIGLCGVLWESEGSAAPVGVQWLAAVLAVLAFVLACVAIFLVGHVAYPLYGQVQETGQAREPTIAERARRLRTGIRITYLALALLVVATLSAWWPSAAPDNGAVQVGDATGEVWCGHLVDAPSREVRLATQDGAIGVPLNQVALLRPVRSC